MHRFERSRCRATAGQSFVADGIKYELQGKIGDGAAGIVRKARNKATGQIVAVKFLAPDQKYIEPSSFDDVASRFRREGIRGTGLSHENLIRILAYEENEDGRCFGGRVINPFFVMEYIRGHTLESLIRHLASNLPEYAVVDQQTLTIAARVSFALETLHTLKIVHRDVKPANIFLSTNKPGTIPAVVKLGDFGVTKWGDFRAAVATGVLTVSHQQGLGTLKYMSPEQCVKPKDVGVRSDMFSLGITLFELFTGKILPSPQHVFRVMSVRDNRGTTAGKLAELGVRCSFGTEEEVFDLMLDMFLSSPQGRPSSSRARGFFEVMLEKASGEVHRRARLMQRKNAILESADSGTVISN